MSEKRSETSVSGKSFVRGKTIDDEERRGRPQAARVVRRVVAERRALPGGKKSSGGGKGSVIRLRRPLPKGPAHAEAARRVTVKVGYVANRKSGQWAAHGSYLERENAQQEGEKGHGFDALDDSVSLQSKLHEWQMSGDPRLFKVVLAPENGDRLDLQQTTRELMQRLAPHLTEDPRDVEWVAIDHHNTGHPHVHLLIRGKSGLLIPQDVIRSGMRELASEVVTERLGYKSPAEQRQSLEQQIEARSFTSLDRKIESLALPLPDGRSVLAEVVKKPRDPGYEDQRQRMLRLEALERLGLAEKIGHSSWALDAGWTKGLRELEVVRTRTKMIAESRALMTEPRCLPQVTKLKPGERLVGRVLGTGLDEQYDRSYVLIEGTDYRAHIVYQNAAIEKARAAQELGLRHLVSIEGRSFEKDGKSIPYTAVEDYGLVIPDKPAPVKVPEKALDDALDAGMQAGQPQESVTGFQRYWHEQLLERSRIRALEKEKAERARQEQERLQSLAAESRGEEKVPMQPQPTKAPQPAAPRKPGRRGQGDRGDELE